MIDLKTVWHYYLEHSKAVVKLYDNPKILKTDADNEANNRPQPGGIAGNIKGNVTCIEYEQRVVDKAKAILPNNTILQGDIRNLLFKDETFDIIIDLSTIDHIRPEEIEIVITGYYRVLKHDGCLLLIAWFGDKIVSDNSRNQPWMPTRQYYFWELDIQKLLDKYFIIKDNEKFYGDDQKYLKRFVCVKR